MFLLSVVAMINAHTSMYQYLPKLELGDEIAVSADAADCCEKVDVSASAGLSSAGLDIAVDDNNFIWVQVRDCVVGVTLYTTPGSYIVYNS